MEVAHAIAVAKQASANVLIAQQQVQAAKEGVLHQQRLASEKETHAELLRQKTEAAAAIQRSEAAAAAQGVILHFGGIFQNTTKLSFAGDFGSSTIGCR